ncbi:MAG: type 1 glutamine amidotransferase [Thermoplasmatota archaeon]
MPPGILVIQNARGEDLGLFAPALAAEGIEARYCRPFEGDQIPSTVFGHSGLIVLGGPQHVPRHEQWPYLAREMALIREAHATRTAFLGVCLGSQLAAAALGGRARPGERGPEVGWDSVTLTDDGAEDPLFAGEPRRLDVFQAHGDTFELPPGAVNLATSPKYPNQAFRLGARTYALQFHAEFSREGISAACRGDPLAGALLAEEEKRRTANAAQATRIFSRWLALACTD